MSKIKRDLIEKLVECHDPTLLDFAYKNATMQNLIADVLGQNLLKPDSTDYCTVRLLDDRFPRITVAKKLWSLLVNEGINDPAINILILSGHYPNEGKKVINLTITALIADDLERFPNPERAREIAKIILIGIGVAAANATIAALGNQNEEGVQAAKEVLIKMGRKIIPTLDKWKDKDGIDRSWHIREIKEGITADKSGLKAPENPIIQRNPKPNRLPS